MTQQRAVAAMTERQSVDVAPDGPARNLRDKRMGHAIADSKFGNRRSARTNTSIRRPFDDNSVTEGANFAHLIVCQLGASMGHAMVGFRGVVGSILRIHIREVLFLRTEPEMGWITAATVIAPVQNLATIYFAVREHVCNSVRASRRATPSAPVSTVVYSLKPRPTGVGAATHIDIIPERIHAGIRSGGVKNQCH